MKEPLIIQVVSEIVPDKMKAFNVLSNLSVEELEVFEAEAECLMHEFCEENPDIEPSAELLAVFREKWAAKKFMDIVKVTYANMSEFVTDDYMEKIVKEEEQYLENPGDHEEMTQRLINRMEEDFPGIFRKQ